MTIDKIPICIQLKKRHCIRLLAVAVWVNANASKLSAINKKSPTISKKRTVQQLSPKTVSCQQRVYPISFMCPRCRKKTVTSVRPDPICREGNMCMCVLHRFYMIYSVCIYVNSTIRSLFLSPRVLSSSIITYAMLLSHFGASHCHRIRFVSLFPIFYTHIRLFAVLHAYRAHTYNTYYPHNELNNVSGPRARCIQK